MSSADHERRRRIIRILRVFAVVLVFLLIFLPFALGFMAMWVLTKAPCAGGHLPSEYGMTDFEAVTFPSMSLPQDIDGFLVHGTNGITIILPPALSTGAGNWRPDYVVLNRHGYSLLSYESPNCAGGTNSLGYQEVEQVGDALHYLATRPDIDMNRFGIHGFSAAGATSLMAAARYPSLKAVIAMGGYHDFGATLEVETNGAWYGALYAAGTRVGYRLATGEDISVLSPIATISKIAPRPILLIYGTREPSLAGAHLQLAAAGPNAELWLVPDATHGSYWQHAAEAFETQVIAFLDDAFAIER